jgi:hypothetical protein
MIDRDNHNVMARRVTIAHELVGLIPGERDAIQATNDFAGNDAAWYARLGRHMGDVADALAYGNTPIEDELLKLAACSMAWIDAIGKERSR